MRKFYVAIGILSSFLMLALNTIGFISGNDSGTVYSCNAVFAERYGASGLAMSKGFPPVLHANNLGSDGASRENAGVIFYTKIAEEGFYDLEVYYLCGSNDRYLELSINGGAGQKIMCPGDDWNVLKSAHIQIPLKKGLNSLDFGNAEWYAPNLNKIVLYKTEITENVPDTDRYQPELEEFKNGTMTLLLDKANGTYSISKNEELIISKAFCAVSLEGVKVYSQEYSSHEIENNGDYISFTHKKDGSPDLLQKFYLKTDCILTDVSVKNAASAWISPLYTKDDKSLDGGKSFLQVPFDNDNYASYKLADVNSIDKSYEMTALFNNKNESAAVIGSVTHDTWKTGIEWRGIADSVKSFCVYGGVADAETRDTQPHGIVSGAEIVSPRIFIGKYDDWRDGLIAYGEANADVASPLQWDGSAPMGWSSWGVVQSNLTKEIAYAVSDYYKEEFQDIWQEDDSAIYINLDAYWNHVLVTDEDLRDFVEYCEANGQKAGIYHTPFVAWSDEEGMKGNYLYDALLRDADGNVLPTWDGALALDVTHPKVIARIADDIQRFIDAGFSYLKMDFLSHGAMEGKHYDESVQTGLQAYNQAMGRIERQINGKMFINLSIAPIFPHQYANGRRLACDTFYSIGSTRYLLNSHTFGFWQSKIYGYPDPDHLLVWGSEGQAEENEGRARVTSGIVAASFLAGDDFVGNINNANANERFDLLLKNPDIMALARTGKTFAPAERPKSGASNIYYLEESDAIYIAVFNFNDKPQNVTLDLNSLAGAGKWSIKELWSGEGAEAEGNYTVNIATHDARVYCLTK